MDFISNAIWSQIISMILTDYIIKSHFWCQMKRMNCSADFLSCPFHSQFVETNQSKYSHFGTLKGLTPIKFSSSNTHSIFLSDQMKLYGFGSNSNHQISSKKLKLFALPIQIDLVKDPINSYITEIACGDNFSVVITNDKNSNDSNNTNIQIFGQINKIFNFPIARGLSANKKSYSFAYSLNNVYIEKIGEESTQHELPEPILMTSMNDFCVFALGQSGKVYIFDYNQPFYELNIPEHVLRISASHDCLTMLCENCVFVYFNEKLYNFYYPKHFSAIDATSSFGDVFALSDTGKIAHSLIISNNHELFLNSAQFNSFNIIHKKYLIPKNNNRESNKEIEEFDTNNMRVINNKFDSYSFINLHGNSALFVSGNPVEYEYVPNKVPIKPSFQVKSADFKDTFLCCTSKTLYFNHSTLPYSHLPVLLSREYHKNSDFYYTAANNFIELSTNQEDLLPFNFSVGDLIHMKTSFSSQNNQENSENENSDSMKSVDELVCEVMGTFNELVWVRPSNSGYVMALPKDLSSFYSIIDHIDRPGHELHKYIIDNHEEIVDVTPSVIEVLGYSIGDLLWHPNHGIVEVIGVNSNKIVLLEYENRNLFTNEAIPLKILRKSQNSKNQATRDVVNDDGEVITLDVTCSGNIIFQPTDRVLSPQGEATILGFNGVPYIQTDEMRMNGYEAIPSNVFDLKLIRRINGIAKRKVCLESGEEIEVSLNTEDTKRGLLPGDKILVQDKVSNVVGFNSEQVIIQDKGSQKCRILTNSFCIIYRADITASRTSNILPEMSVGSPFIQESLYLPGDRIYNDDFGECEFHGYSKNNVFMVSKSEIFTLSFSMLLLPDFFSIKERPVLNFWPVESHH
ncbi:hypothetical protein TRFO_39559 [Tritrichomonas foetus]|uniref:Uncharacterized protein n=1 Tax=Tritrichomonas foetus TaxID=1144522 RepID=A0A1J4J4E5_9EUKA|nr:hypothetical protein TRFO_39559 [Tritrichomonas foetus]|eukprot:OHS94248.1 hypothetical protein TRFO_39559 [Tritrichomonas foetus]